MYDFSDASIFTEDAGQVTNELIQYLRDVTAVEDTMEYEEVEVHLVLLFVEDASEVPVNDGDSKEEEGERLPETAILTWTIGLAGLGSVAAGASAHFIKKKK